MGVRRRHTRPGGTLVRALPAGQVAEGVIAEVDPTAIGAGGRDPPALQVIGVGLLDHPCLGDPAKLPDAVTS